MSDLKTEIRAAFDREQAAFPPQATFRGEIVNAVAAAPARAVHREEPNLQRLAVAAAVLVTIAIVAGLMAIRFNQRPAPARDYGPPPAGSNLLYVADPDHPTWLIGYSWAGHPRATVKLATPADPESARVIMAPDGGAFESFTGNGVMYLDGIGRSIAAGSLPDVNSTISHMWADDNRHLCFIRVDTTGRVWRLMTKLPGEADHQVTVIATNADPSNFTASVGSCSIKNDEAIVFSGSNDKAGVMVIRLSTGVVVSSPPSRTFHPGEFLVASSDGAYVAETAEPPAVSSVIRRVSDWTVVSPRSIPFQVVGFSGDSSLVFGSRTDSDPMLWHYAVVDWRTGATLWKTDGQLSMYSFTAEPGGTNFAVAFGDAPLPRPICPFGSKCVTFVPVRVIEIVHANGSVTRIPGNTPTW